MKIKYLNIILNQIIINNNSIQFNSKILFIDHLLIIPTT